MSASRACRLRRHVMAVSLSVMAACLGASLVFRPALAAVATPQAPSTPQAPPAPQAARSHAHAVRPDVGTARPRRASATIAVGRLPDSVAVDQRNGTVWVANSLDGTVSEISEASLAVMATIRVAASPVGISADPRTGTIWVTCLGPFGRPAADNVVTEISDDTGKVLATVKVGRAPFGVAADPGTGMVWVANTNSATLSEISEKDADVVATVRLSRRDAPDGVAVDSRTGTVWVASLGGRVEEVTGATRSTPRSAARSFMLQVGRARQ